MHSYGRLEAWKQAFGSAAEAECLALAAGEGDYLEMVIVKQLEDMFGGAMRALRALLRNPPNTG